MSGVVLRCPNCGTTKASPGECEACHEAEVCYYCTNHTPGHWLDAPVCPQCGARFGDPVRPPAPPPPPAPKRTPTPARASAPASTSAPRTGSTSWRPRAGVGPWGRRRKAPALEEALEARDEEAAAREAVLARLPELLRTASRARRAPWGRTPVADDAPPPVGLALGGCLLRLVFLAVFLLIALFVMSALVGGSLLQILGGVYYF